MLLQLIQNNTQRMNCNPTKQLMLFCNFRRHDYWKVAGYHTDFFMQNVFTVFESIELQKLHQSCHFWGRPSFLLTKIFLRRFSKLRTKLFFRVECQLIITDGLSTPHSQLIIVIDGKSIQVNEKRCETDSNRFMATIFWAHGKTSIPKRHAFVRQWSLQIRTSETLKIKPVLIFKSNSFLNLIAPFFTKNQ